MYTRPWGLPPLYHPASPCGRGQAARASPNNPATASGAAACTHGRGSVRAQRQSAWVWQNRHMLGWLGKLDSIHHAVSACSELGPQRTKRYNVAAQAGAVRSNQDSGAAGMQWSARPHMNVPAAYKPACPRASQTRRPTPKYGMHGSRRPGGWGGPTPLNTCRDAWPEQQKQRPLAQ